MLVLKLYGTNGIYFDISPTPYIRFPEKRSKKDITVVYVSVGVQPIRTRQRQIAVITINIPSTILTLEEIRDETIFKKFFIDWLNNQINGGEKYDDFINIDKIYLYLLENYQIEMVIK